MGLYRNLFMYAVVGCCLFTGVRAAETVRPPVAEVKPVTDVYFGTPVVDDYRWMESEPEPRFRSLLELQDSYARAALTRIPGRDALAKDIASISGLATRLSTIFPVGSERFYVKRPPNTQNAKLYMSDAGTGVETLLLDPEKLGKPGEHVEIDQFSPSQDGKLVAYTLSSGGSEQGTMRILDVSRRTDLPDIIDRAQLAIASWLPDGRSFFYTRLAKLPPNASPYEHFAHLRVCWHHLGQSADSDEVVLDADHLPFSFPAQQVFPFLALFPGSDIVIAGLSDGVSPEYELYGAKLSEVVAHVGRPKPGAPPVQAQTKHAPEIAAQPVWKTIAKAADGVTYVSVRGSEIYLLTHEDAPRFRIVRENLAAPDFSKAKEIVKQGARVITGMAIASDGLYFTERAGGGMALYHLPDAASSPSLVKLPYNGTIQTAELDAGGLVANPRREGALFSLESWVRPVAWFSVNSRNAVSNIGIVQALPRDTSRYETIETEAVAPDGTHVPLTVVWAKGSKRDGTHPCILDGYGSYGIPNDASFQPFVLAWIDRGGVFAVAHVRGGGELGQPWHDGGKRENKANAIADFIACAEEMVKARFTAPSRLTAMGTSAGGITVGGAINRRPDLFRVAIIRVGESNVLRSEFTQGGPANVPEFGTVKDPAQFKALLETDAVHNVRAGVAYPAVLLTGGFNDPRVPVWDPAKMAARLQAASSSGRPVLFRVEFDAGHGIGSMRSQQDEEFADELAFALWQSGTQNYQIRAP